MGRLLRLILAALACSILAAGAASAHTKSETHSAWQIADQTVRLQFTIPDIESKRLTKDGSQPSDAQLGAYIAKNLGATAAGAVCKTTEGPRTVTAAQGYRRVEFAYECPSTKQIQVFSHAFFDIVPTHVNFAQIQTSDGKFFEQLMTSDHQSLDVSGSGSENRLQNASFLQYIQMGIMHIFTGVDHMSFLVGLVLISRRLRDLTFVITGFTLGHSATLALAVTGVIRPHAEFIDALVALTIALIGAENIAVATHRPAIVAAGVAVMMLAMTGLRLMGIGVLPVLLLFGGGLFSANYLMISGHLRDAGRLRLIVTLVFGLVHGFGFASDLLQMKLPAARLAELLVGFNLGVEIGQLSLVLSLTLIVYLLSKAKLTLPRPIVVDVAASFLVCLGMYWFISRSF